VTTAAATFRFVSWSRGKLLTALESARQTFGEAERGLVLQISRLASDLRVSADAETLNAAARILFEASGAKPSWMEVLSRIEFGSLTNQRPEQDNTRVLSEDDRG
jgi:hypothetical protein